ncbi:phosphoribosylaminoimidazolesuccinocarboxamide synthase [Actinotignum sp. GS-2025a]|uniref:phosphoribosylaminoimidazolesuccinocarboxamide synthase n=1 Tax=Actinotignum sp. GS-2025a TaxID=3427274 RepID=UPI003F4690FF
MSTYTTGSLVPIRGWQRTYSGKVHDLYRPVPGGAMAGMDTYLIVASDRIAAFDHVVPTFIPDKGEILTRIARWWFDRTGDIAESHYLPGGVPRDIAARGILVRALRMLPYEVLVRGYLTAGAVRSLESLGTLDAMRYDGAIELGAKLELPWVGIAEKRRPGCPDIPIPWDEFMRRVGESTAERVRVLALNLYRHAHAIALARGLVLADAKLEFGTDMDAGSSRLILADEAFTPDTAHYWLSTDYRAVKAGEVPPTPEALRPFDKDAAQVWLMSAQSGWNAEQGTQPPALPAAVVADIRERYLRVCEMLTGERWPGH